VCGSIAKNGSGVRAPASFAGICWFAMRAVAVTDAIEGETSVSPWGSEAVSDLNRLVHIGSIFYLKVKGINPD
jgi:hypothetical protein